MVHRHLNTTEWSLTAIDSLLERGNLPDWREFFSAARSDRALAERAMKFSRTRDVPGASKLFAELLKTIWPDLSRS